VRGRGQSEVGWLKAIRNVAGKGGQNEKQGNRRREMKMGCLMTLSLYQADW
jgi:hypothetical protein